jgi:F-type H+-transporting ATPase subunit gamma
MSSTNEIRQRINAVEQTRKITGAMEMVSSNRMRRVMSHLEYNRRYFGFLRQTMRDVLSSGDIVHRYLYDRPAGQRTYIVFSGDKGLCGSYNSAVLALADKCLAENPGSMLVTVGNTAEDHYRKLGRVPDISWYGVVQDPTMKSARYISGELTHLYDNRSSAEICAVYTSFFGDTKGKPVVFQLLPVALHNYDDATLVRKEGDEIVYHPSAQAMFDALVPQYMVCMMFEIMVQAYAGEQFARMNAMHSATENAGDMMKSLRTQYNLARQSAITNEIAEITGAAEVLNAKKRPMNLH